MANTYVSGTDGRLKLGSTSVAGITSWKLNKKVAEVPTPHFELTADGDGVVWNTFLVGLADATVDFEGMYDVGTPQETAGISVGLSVTLDLVLSKATPWGYNNVVGFVTSFVPGTAIENQPAKFTAAVRLTGVVAKAATIT